MMRRTTPPLLLALALLCAGPLAPAARAEGLSARIDAYLDAVDEGRALDQIPNVTDLSPRRAAVARRERDLAAELAGCTFNGGDLAKIVTAAITRRRTARAAAEAHPEVLDFPAPVSGVTGAEGAVVRTGPHSDSPLAQVYRPWTHIRVLGRAGEWLRLSTGEYLHGLLADIDLDEPTTADVPTAYTRIKDQKPTYYMTAREDGFPTSGLLYGVHYDGTEKKTIQTPAGEVLARTSGRFFACLCMEGSGILHDGRTVSYVSSSRFELMPAGCKGRGSTGNWVVPFHTLAVNPREMSYGTVYYVPRTAGLTLPDGTVHDGFWFAHDTGSAFQGTPKHRMDMYVDLEANIAWAEAHVVPSFTPLPVYRVDPATQRAVLAKYKDQLGQR